MATADAVKQAVLQQQVELIEADEAQEEKIMEKLRRIGRCPAGQRTMHFPQALLQFSVCSFRDATGAGLVWYKTEGGYICEGGGHFVTDEQLNYEDDEDGD